MRRNPEDAEDYYRSKILADRKVGAFLEKHADMWAFMVLSGWMVGPGDVGPTSSGQVILDFLHRRLPGIPPATFPVVDARDVTEAMWLGRRKEVAVNATLPRHGTWRWGSVSEAGADLRSSFAAMDCALAGSVRDGSRE